MNKPIKFQCVTDCSSICCGGATILTLKEIVKLFKFFPITLGFRKIQPFNAEHKVYLDDISIEYRGFYIAGDFIGGNRFKKRCRLLKNSLCTIHNQLKPLQCRVIPFSVTFPEFLQDLVIVDKKRGAFRECKGFYADAPLIWDGQFIDKSLKENFDILKKHLMFQRDIVEKIFLSLEGNSLFKKFIQTGDGFLEVPILPEFVDEICSVTGILDRVEFLRAQKSLFVKELTFRGMKNSLFIDALNTIEQLRI